MDRRQPEAPPGDRGAGFGEEKGNWRARSSVCDGSSLGGSPNPKASARLGDRRAAVNQA